MTLPSPPPRFFPLPTSSSSPIPPLLLFFLLLPFSPPLPVRCALPTPLHQFIASSSPSPLLTSDLQDLTTRSLQAPSPSVSPKEPLVVRGDMIDPLDRFREYKGGYDIRNRHYWASIAFTGIYGYSIAAICLLVGLAFGLLGCVKYFCDKELKAIKQSADKPEQSNLHHCAPSLTAILLAALIIASLGVVLTGNQHFEARAKKMEGTILDAADNARITIDNVTVTLAYMGTLLRPYDQSSAEIIQSASATLNDEALALQGSVARNRAAIDKGLRILYIAIAAIASINLTLVTFGLLFMLLHIGRLLSLIIVLCWIFVILNWLAFGIYFASSNFVDDTCLAMEEYQRNPHNTTLDSILPCVDLVSANDADFVARETIYNLLLQANMNISVLREQSREAGKTKLESFPLVCAPISGPPDYNFTGTCYNGTVPVGKIPQLLNSLRCSNNKNTGDCVDESTYHSALAFTTVAQSLLDILPGMKNLTNCSFVLQTFSTIASQQCRPLKSAARTVWAAMVSNSTLMILIIVLWVAWRFQSRHRNFGRGTIIPHNIPSPTRIL